MTYTVLSILGWLALTLALLLVGLSFLVWIMREELADLLSDSCE